MNVISTLTLKDLCISCILNNDVMNRDSLPSDLLQELKYVSSFSLKRIAKLAFLGGRIGLYLLSPVNEGMKYAARVGHRGLVDFFIAKGATALREGMWQAARGGHLHLVEFFLTRISLHYLNIGMCKAARNGSKELVDFFIVRGANNWNEGLRYAARGGHSHLVKFFIERGNIHRIHHLNCGLYAAGRAGSLSLVKFFVDKGANDWRKGINSAARGGNQEIVEFLIAKYDGKWETMELHHE